MRGALLTLLAGAIVTLLQNANYFILRTTFFVSLLLVSKYSPTSYCDTHGTFPASPRSALAPERFSILATPVAVLDYYRPAARGTMLGTIYEAPGSHGRGCATSEAPHSRHYAPPDGSPSVALLG